VIPQSFTTLWWRSYPFFGEIDKAGNAISLNLYFEQGLGWADKPGFIFNNEM
jgi:hypothetical protein